ncbi:hypothetical protein EDB80DRAFT_214169 [Ilyonectria destructans]|nr:hypothetical protein EDB80DRAFT_214169 [Ilyonectria destructans]
MPPGTAHIRTYPWWRLLQISVHVPSAACRWACSTGQASGPVFLGPWPVLRCPIYLVNYSVRSIRSTDREAEAAVTSAFSLHVYPGPKDSA